jgi:hypothetical protein
MWMVDNVLLVVDGELASPLAGFHDR